MLPFQQLPILTPPSDVQCPNPGGDPLVTSTVDRGVIFQIDYLIFTNTSIPDGTLPPPATSTGPIYFEKQPLTSIPSDITVISYGCREPYSGGTFVETRPPIGPSTTRLEMTFDSSLLNPAVSSLNVTMSFGFSTEAGFDFFVIYVDDKIVSTSTGFGTESSPYISGNVSFSATISSIVRIEYSKDAGFYQGVDATYFYIDSVSPVVIPSTPTSLIIKRGTDIIQNYGLNLNLDDPSFEQKFLSNCDLDIMTGDQLCLATSIDAYSSYEVTLTLQNIPQILDHTKEETFSAPVHFNEISYNNRSPSDESVLQGWYETDYFVQNLSFIENIESCGSNPGGIRVTSYSTVYGGGAYFVNPYRSRGVFFMTRVAPNTYDVGGTVYIFHPETGELRLDSTATNLPAYGAQTGTIYRPVGNPDERYWQYAFDLLDPNHQFNTQLNFFDFLIEKYKTGYFSSQFGIKSFSTWPDVNPMNLDMTKVESSFGDFSAQEYDNLARKLRDMGVYREVTVKRFIYYAQPGIEFPVLSATQKTDLKWQVNHNRYPFLGFTTVPLFGEGEKVYPRFLSGETVTMTGTNTRLDNFPLRIAMDGYHTGPKPSPEFMQTYSGVDPRNGNPIPDNKSYDIFNEWGLYTFRLPITIDETNRHIYSRNGGVDNQLSPNGQLTLTFDPSVIGEPFVAVPGQSGVNLVANPFSGVVVPVDPITAATATTNILSTTIDTPSDGLQLPQPVIYVLDTSGFPTSGQLSIETPEGPFTTVTYTGITPSSFTGVSGGSGTLATAYFVSPLVTLPSSTIPVIDTTGFPVSGRLILFDTLTLSGQTVTYTGITSTSFTGVSGGSGLITPYINLLAPLTNAADINGNVALIEREGGIGFAQKAYLALDAGATGVIFFNNVPGPAFSPNVAAIPIATVMISLADGQTLLAASTSTPITVTINLPPILHVDLPIGTYYLSDLYDFLWEEYLAGRTEFFIEPGNYESKDIGVNGLFAFAGTVFSLLYGPDDANFPSNFFGPSGLNVAYLWPVTSTPLIAPNNLPDANDYVGAYAALMPGEYKTHTPLTSLEAQALIDAASNRSALVFTTHGPVTNDMSYDKFIACVNELSMAKGTEVHTVIFPWTRKIDNGLMELPISAQKVFDLVNQIFIDPSINYDSPIISPYVPLVNLPDAFEYAFAPTLWSAGVRQTGTGHPGEYSENYMAGSLRSLTEQMSREEGRLEWIVPEERFYYPLGTILPSLSSDPIYQDVSNREVEVTIVNYLRDPMWLHMTTITTPGPYFGATDYDFIPYTASTNPYAFTRPGSSPRVIDFSQVAGSWLCGVLRDDKAREILALPPLAPVTERVGYITWYNGEWSGLGDLTILPWYDPKVIGYNTDSSGIAGAARVLQYLLSQDCKHIVIDVRNNAGGSDQFWGAFAQLVGDHRYFSEDTLYPILSLQPNGITPVASAMNFERERELTGIDTYLYQTSLNEINPQGINTTGQLSSLIPNALFNGVTTGQTARGRVSNIIWITNATTISNPQAEYLILKGTSIPGIDGTNNYDGNFGLDTHFIGYGVYYRPFSAAGEYDSFMNWWTRGRKGEEQVHNPIMASIDRQEESRVMYHDQQDIDGNGGIFKGTDQEFSKLQQPQIKWNMDSDVFFQDIGFVLGNPGVNPSLDGEPWVNSRPGYESVRFDNPLTWRDTAFERAVQMVNDPNLESQYYLDNGYGYVTELP